MYVCSFPHIGLCVDVCSSVDEQSHHLRVPIASSCYQGGPSILSETHIDTYLYVIVDAIGHTVVVEISASAYIIPGLDVRPPVQEDLDNLKMTTLNSTVECGRPTLSKTQRRD